jgi:riboflavin transporter FmnP
VNTREIALTVCFAGLAIVLNPAISGIGIPYPLLPGMIFQIWEIPTVVAFLLFGFIVGFSVAAVNSVFLLAVYPGMAQPWYWLGSLVSVSSMMLGVWIANRIIRHTAPENRNPLRSKTLVAYLALGVLFRVVFMAPVMLLILSILTYPSISVLGVVKVVLPLQAIFNILVPLYMIPSGYLIAKIINRNLRIGNEIG